MLKVSGSVLLALGLVSGCLLIFGPLGFSTVRGLAPWLLFPVLTAGGFLLLALASATPQVGFLLRLAGTLLLVLALSAAAGLVLVASAILTPATSTLSLWYVLGVGAIFGAAGLLAHRPLSGVR